MACGSRYEHLVRVPGGHNKENPFGLWCAEPDAELWHAQAIHVHSLQFAAWNVLMGLENNRDTYPYTDKLRPMAEAYDASVDSLPEPSAWMAFGAGDCAKVVGQYIANIEQGACVLEQLNDAIETYGFAPVNPGGTGNSWEVPGWLWGVGVAAAVAGGVVAYVKLAPDGDA